MRTQAPILASETTAARLLDLGTRQFRALVEEGHLPQGHEIAPGVVRWDTDLLKKISNGQGTGDWEQIQW
jgi:hypothetical protein